MDSFIEREIARAVGILAAGGVVCYPTETFYGLAADALAPDAVARVVAMKRRGAGAPIATIVPDLVAAGRLWETCPESLRALATRYWPGPLTIVAPALAYVPAPLVGEWGVGARVSSHPVAQALARAFGGPITATSANRAGLPPAETTFAARAQLGEAVELYLDDGPAPGGAPSTVVTIVSGSPRILRVGAISIDFSA